MRITRSAKSSIAQIAIAALGLSFLASCGGAASTTPVRPALGGAALGSLPASAIRHVFIVMLENENEAKTFGATTPAPYLAQTLTAQGAFLPNYYGTGHVSLDNYISLVSGQSATPDTDNDCTNGFNTVTPATVTTNGQVQGTGCVYPPSVLTIADQITAAGGTWRGYMGDMGNDPTRESATCGHPVIGTIDMTQIAEAPSANVPTGDAYATRHDPFMYFHSIIDSPSCNTNVVNLNNLTNDLASVATTANYTFITPNLCDDGHDAPCANGQPGGLTSINTFLMNLVPEILASPAYKQDGLLLITFDESSYSGFSVSGTTYNITEAGTTCCNQQEGPNLGAFPQTLTASAGSVTYNITKQSFGGDAVGAVLLSPFIKPGTVSTVPYNHYSTLLSLETIFGLTPLGYAGAAGLTPFGNDIFTNP